MKKGLFAVFEGPDGVGKTTVLNLVAQKLAPKVEIITTREPGGQENAEAIRTIILERDLDGITEALLFAAARNEHWKKKILPALDEGKIVLSDRFLHSSIAYQGFGRDLGPENIEALNDWFLKGKRPDLVFYLSCDPQIIRKRLSQRESENRLDQKDEAFEKAIEKGFETYRDQMQLIDASRQADQIADEIATIILETYGQS